MITTIDLAAVDRSVVVVEDDEGVCQVAVDEIGATREAVVDD